MKLDRNGKAAVTLKLDPIDKQNFQKKVEAEQRTMQGQLVILVQRYIKEDSDVITKDNT